MKKSSIPMDELILIFKWADTARSNEDFWNRLQLASAAYGATAQINMAKLVACANAIAPERAKG